MGNSSEQKAEDALMRAADERWYIADAYAEVVVTSTHGPKQMAFCATWDDYDGAPDSLSPMGLGATAEEATGQLVENTYGTSFDDGRISTTNYVCTVSESKAA